MANSDSQHLGAKDAAEELEHGSSGSVTILIEELREAGDEAAANKLFARYFEQLVYKLQDRVNRRVRSYYDSEDAASFALTVVLKNLVEGRFPDLADRDSLWNLLVHIGDLDTKRAWRRETAKKRDVRRNQQLTALTNSDGSTPAAFDIEGDEIPPGMLAKIEDMVAYLSEKLSKREYHDILLWELEGYTPDEIKQAIEEKLQRTITNRTIRRWRALMRAELQAAYPTAPFEL